MKKHQSTALGRSMARFFQEYLPALRGMSHHTIQSYRDTMVLFLRFAAAEINGSVESIDISDINADRIGSFLTSLEVERGNSIATRNARLAAMHTFARFLISEHPEYMDTLQLVVTLPFKRGARVAPVEYLEEPEIKSVLARIDRRTPSGQRDYALFSLMFNTGARVQEILNLRICDLRLVSPCQVRLHGKGNKVRLCPIWRNTAQLLQELINTLHPPSDNPADQRVFLNDRGTPLTRFGVRYLLRKYVDMAAGEVTTLAEKSIHPHSLRHTTAIHLLKAGVDIATISQWLGHSGLNVTMRYARADIDMKRQALEQVFPDVMSSAKDQTIIAYDGGMLGWLRRL
ncbi:tyrosine-type recombinase/integrase [Ensifer sp. ENS01]|uniref:tyrosine-type recombinase/integrase n=1 Tax=Ensifer sp. ENS01 TaxID=2769293 RepID=UPI0017801380|nr:tyrosine-type recombinase/integrase [Ensifer sp. ENS01]MBD9496899.1 site-specific integrase [Ensifer sp. ENS01]